MWQHWSIPYTFPTWLQLIFMFPPLKSAPKGWRFYDSNDTVKTVTELMKRFAQNGFQECFQHLQSRWCWAGAVLKEMLLKWLYCFVCLRNKVIPGTFWSYHVFLYSVVIHISPYFTPTIKSTSCLAGQYPYAPKNSKGGHIYRASMTQRIAFV